MLISLMNIDAKIFKKILADFPGGAVVKNLPANAGDTGSSPSLEDPTSPWATTTSPSAVEPTSHSY